MKKGLLSRVVLFVLVGRLPEQMPFMIVAGVVSVVSDAAILLVPLFCGVRRRSVLIFILGLA